MMSVFIELERWEYEHASNIGIRRFTENWDARDAKHYDRTRMEDDRTAQVAAAICELAVAKHTNQYWHGHVWRRSEHAQYRDMPDVGNNIEVKRIRTSSFVPVRTNGRGRNLVLWACKPIMPEFRVVEVIGRIPHDYAWENGTPSDYSPRTTRLFPLEKMSPP